VGLCSPGVAISKPFEIIHCIDYGFLPSYVFGKLGDGYFLVEKIRPNMQGYTETELIRLCQDILRFPRYYNFGLVEMAEYIRKYFGEAVWIMVALEALGDHSH